MPLRRIEPTTTINVTIADKKLLPSISSVVVAGDNKSTRKVFFSFSSAMIEA
ncbi:hypothetical protein D3C78_1270120 [compost metagenome]